MICEVKTEHGIFVLCAPDTVAAALEIQERLEAQGKTSRFYTTRQVKPTLKPSDAGCPDPS